MRGTSEANDFDGSERLVAVVGELDGSEQIVEPDTRRNLGPQLPVPSLLQEPGDLYLGMLVERSARIDVDTRGQVGNPVGVRTPALPHVPTCPPIPAARGWTESAQASSPGPSGRGLRCRRSVSYTHLDVYKRQGVLLPSVGASGGSGTRGPPCPDSRRRAAGRRAPSGIAADR